MPTRAISTAQLRTLRKARGFKTQKQLAKKTGIREGTISDWESGKVLRIDLATLDKFCTALRCGLGDLLQRTTGRKSKHESWVRAALHELDWTAGPIGDYFVGMSPAQVRALKSIQRHHAPALENMRACVKAAERSDTWTAVYFALKAATEEGEALGEAGELDRLDALASRKGKKRGGAVRQYPEEALKAEKERAIKINPRLAKSASSLGEVVARKLGASPGHIIKRYREIAHRTPDTAK